MTFNLNSPLLKTSNIGDLIPVLPLTSPQYIIHNGTLSSAGDNNMFTVYDHPLLMNKQPPSPQLLRTQSIAHSPLTASSVTSPSVTSSPDQQAVYVAHILAYMPQIQQNAQNHQNTSFQNQQSLNLFTPPRVVSAEEARRQSTENRILRPILSRHPNLVASNSTHSPVSFSPSPLSLTNNNNNHQTFTTVQIPELIRAPQRSNLLSNNRMFAMQRDENNTPMVLPNMEVAIETANQNEDINSPSVAQLESSRVRKLSQPLQIVTGFDYKPVAIFSQSRNLLATVDQPSDSPIVKTEPTCVAMDNPNIEVSSKHCHDEIPREALECDTLEMSERKRDLSEDDESKLPLKKRRKYAKLSAVPVTDQSEEMKCSDSDAKMTSPEKLKVESDVTSEQCSVFEFMQLNVNRRRPRTVTEGSSTSGISSSTGFFGDSWEESSGYCSSAHSASATPTPGVSLRNSPVVTSSLATSGIQSLTPRGLLRVSCDSPSAMSSCSSASSGCCHSPFHHKSQHLHQDLHATSVKTESDDFQFPEDISQMTTHACGEASASASTEDSQASPNGSQSGCCSKTSSSSSSAVIKTFIRHRSQNKTRDKPYKCTHPGCDKAYGKAAHLHSHMRIHTGERPFACDWPGCNKHFVRSDELKRHKRVHTGENRFKCPVCDKLFKRSDHLTKHAKKHPNFHMDMLRRPEDIEKRRREIEQLESQSGEVSTLSVQNSAIDADVTAKISLETSE